MLTISQLARYADVTVATIRHYHKIGLFPEPDRNSSGYRIYDAAAVVRLIRIHILAAAGVPLAQVSGLLEADREEFAHSIGEIDKKLQSEIARLQRTRRKLGMLPSSEQLAPPECVVTYLDRLRELGIAESYIEKERDAWILVAAQVPDQIDDIIERKLEDLNDPDMRRLYELVGLADEISPDDPKLAEVADILDCLFTGASKKGRLNVEGFDDGFVDLLDTMMVDTAPAARQLLKLLEERGWKGWHRIERVRAEGYER